MDVIEGGHLLVGDLDAGRVVGVIELGTDRKPGAGGGGGDELHDGLMALQGSAAPVHRDMAEQPVLDFGPLAGARRQVTHRDRQAGLGGKGGQFAPQAE